MKKISAFFIILLIAVLMLAACSANETQETEPAPLEPEPTAIVNAPEELEDEAADEKPVEPPEVSES